MNVTDYVEREISAGVGNPIPPAPAKGKPCTILVAEDNPDDYALLEAASKSADLSAVLKHAMDGWEARRYLGGEGDFADRSLYAVPDLILCDLKMPRMNGFELLMWLRCQSALRRIPFIMMDSRADQGEVDRAFEQGANSFVAKPKELRAYSKMLELIQRYWLDLNRLPKVD